MSNAKHTPGPWTANEDCSNATDIQGPAGESICSVMNASQEDLTDEDQANALAIVAAPEMLDALKMIVRHEGVLTASGLQYISNIVKKATGGAE